mgnify:CR=1 FL=1
MTRNIGRVAGFLIGMFALLTVGMTYWSVVRGPELAALPNNARTVLLEEQIQRGRILDRNGQVLADTKMTPDGPQRVYTYPSLAPVLGWAKPVPINPGNMHQPRRDMALTAAAGPGMNLLLAIASALLLALILTIEPTLSIRNTGEADTTSSLIGTMFLRPIAVMALYSVMINVFLALFNLLPIPPLDGGRILTAILPTKPALALSRLEPYGMLILVGLIVFDKELGIIHMITGTFAKSLSGTILSTALGLRPGVSE